MLLEARGSPGEAARAMRRASPLWPRAVGQAGDSRVNRLLTIVRAFPTDGHAYFPPKRAAISRAEAVRIIWPFAAGSGPPWSV